MTDGKELKCHPVRIVSALYLYPTRIYFRQAWKALLEDFDDSSINIGIYRYRSWEIISVQYPQVLKPNMANICFFRWWHEEKKYQFFLCFFMCIFLAAWLAKPYFQEEPMLLVTMLLDYVSSSDFKTTITWPYGHLVGHLYGGPFITANFCGTLVTGWTIQSLSIYACGRKTEQSQREARGDGGWGWVLRAKRAGKKKGDLPGSSIYLGPLTQSSFRWRPDILRFCSRAQRSIRK